MSTLTSNYIVYKHASPSGKVYIGITSQSVNRRWRNGDGYKSNAYFTRAIQKYGWDSFKHEILACGLSKEDAENMEIQLIQGYQSNNPDFGYNIDNGGNAMGKRSDATKKKLSEISKANPSRYWLGKHLTEEHKRHAVENRTYARGEEHPRSKRVYCDGTIFESATECAEHYGLTTATITGYCNGIKRVPKMWQDRDLHYV